MTLSLSDESIGKSLLEHLAKLANESESKVLKMICS